MFHPFMVGSIRGITKPGLFQQPPKEGVVRPYPHTTPGKEGWEDGFPASPSTGSGQALDTALAGLLGMRVFLGFLTLSSRRR